MHRCDKNPTKLPMAALSTPSAISESISGARRAIARTPPTIIGPPAGRDKQHHREQPLQHHRPMRHAAPGAVLLAPAPASAGSALMGRPKPMAVMTACQALRRFSAHRVARRQRAGVLAASIAGSINPPRVPPPRSRIAPQRVCRLDDGRPRRQIHGRCLDCPAPAAAHPPRGPRHERSASLPRGRRRSTCGVVVVGSAILWQTIG